MDKEEEKQRIISALDQHAYNITQQLVPVIDGLLLKLRKDISAIEYNSIDGQSNAMLKAKLLLDSIRTRTHMFDSFCAALDQLNHNDLATTLRSHKLEKKYESADNKADAQQIDITDQPGNQQQQQSVSPQHPPPPQRQEPPPDPMNNEPFEKKPEVTAAELEKEYEKVVFEDDDNQEIRKNPEVLIEVVNHTEFQAVISIMKGKVSRHYIKDDLTNSTSTYCLGKLGDIQVVVVQTATRVGSQFQYGSWFETKKALHYFEKLKYIFAVGVCGAVIDKQSGSPRVPLGEVVISSHIIGYDHRKILDGNIEDRGYTEDLSHYDFYSFLQKLGNQGAWRNKIHFGKVLSGSWLVASLAAQHFLLHPDQPDKKAVEMEGVGIAAACKGRGIEAFLVVKGVSDYANSTKNDNWQPHAAKEAASFLSEMLNKYLKIRRSRET